MSSEKSSIGVRHNLSEPVYALWEELADFGAHAIDSALMHCMRSIGDQIGVDDAAWYGWARLSGLGQTEKGVPNGLET